MTNIRNARVREWSGSPDPKEPDNFWIDDRTGERVNAHTGERAARNRLVREHYEKSIVETINGLTIRRICSSQFGRLYQIGEVAFASLEEARAYANGAVR